MAGTECHPPGVMARTGKGPTLVIPRIGLADEGQPISERSFHWSPPHPILAGPVALAAAVAKDRVDAVNAALSDLATAAQR